MNRRNRILYGIFALVVGLSLALPIRALAFDGDHDRDDGHHHEWRWDRDHDGDYHHAWRWDWDHDHYRAYPYAPSAYPNGYRYRNLPENGQGLVNSRNPNLYWACDSDGHHCHWARRF